MTPRHGARTSETLPVRLLEYFSRNSCVRRPRPDRRSEGHEFYKKGWEVRLVLDNETELADARRLLERAGLKPGRPYCKAAKWIQPIYGRGAVEAFGVSGNGASHA